MKRKRPPALPKRTPMPADEQPPIKWPAQARWRATHPQARRAHVLVRAAVRKGTLVKQPCEDCGDPNSEAHHPNYAEPLRVVWLCRQHHKRRHARR